MPVCYITLSEKVDIINAEQFIYIKKIVAEGLDSKSRKLDENHISIRVQYGKRNSMLSDVEIEIFSQLYLRRFFTRDKRSNIISRKISEYLKCGCATWINMCFVGYSRIDINGNNYYSDSNSVLIRMIQKMRGISSD